MACGNCNYYRDCGRCCPVVSGVTIGTVTTTDNCEEVSVTNSGTGTNVVLDFVLPCISGTGISDIIKVTNLTPQSTVSEGALTFASTPLLAGDALSHVNGSPDVIVSEDGIYQAVFNAVVTPTDAAVPENLVLGLYINGDTVSGATEVHHFESTEESANMTFTAIFEIDETPSTLQIIANATAFFSDRFSENNLLPSKKYGILNVSSLKGAFL